MKKILLIQTGGTIAMDINPEGNPQMNEQNWGKLFDEKIPELNDIADIEVVSLFHKDSSDVGIAQWQRLLETISEHYDEYDGFVILHGTDTMAYTASALSFGVKNLGKPVILTGSQVPMANIRSDAPRNLINAVEMATMPLPEVAICFNDYVYRGNRTTKTNISNFNAFASPNYPVLANIGMNIDLRSSAAASSSQPFDIVPVYSDHVLLQKIYPNFSPDIIDQAYFSGLQAVIIEGFGSGNFPIAKGKTLLPFFKSIIERDIPLIITSQAPYDSVDLTNYKSGREALELGAVGAGDMTTEATLTKTMHLLGTDTNGDELKEAIQQNLAGELTITNK